MISQSGTNWSFVSEAQLEDFVWSHLEELFGVTPLARQFSVDNQICDILAVDSEKRLTIIELKNSEDRYLVNQLTRYYDALVTNKSLSESIDYRKSIQLIGITPTFHRDNWSDKKYNRLKIQFWEFNLNQLAKSQFQFSVKNLETKEQKNVSFGFEPVQTEIQILEPPRKLLKMLADTSEGKRGKILEIRKKILSFHERMKEYSSGSAVLYGSAKNKTCAELRFDSKRNDVALFLWIPYMIARPTRNSQQCIARVRIWTNWLTVTDVGHVPKGFGNMVSQQEFLIGKVKPLAKLLPKPRRKQNQKVESRAEKYFRSESTRKIRLLGAISEWDKSNPHYRNGLALPLATYLQLNNKEHSKSEGLEDFVDLALNTWLEKL